MHFKFGVRVLSALIIGHLMLLSDNALNIYVMIVLVLSVVILRSFKSCENT